MPPILNLDAIEQTPVADSPFPYFVTENVLDHASLTAINEDFPDIRSPGIFPLSSLQYEHNFDALINEIQSPELRHLLERKFNVDLEGKPQMITVRGRCQRKDGRIHNDSKDKIVTCLLYLNESWGNEGGRLRLLRDSRNLDNMIAEVPPVGGTMIAFRRTDNSWHGHYPYEGQRRYVMFNWVTSEATLGKNLLRHRVSAIVKKGLASLGYRNDQGY